MLNAIGSIVYLAVAVLCVRASMAAGGKASGRGDRLVWLGAAVFFCALALMRAFALEEAIRDGLRTTLVHDGAYAARRSFQSVLAVLLILGVIAASLFAWSFLHRRRSERAVHWAIFGIIIMTGLVTLRIISFHATDSLLYGPLHLNWFIDIGASVLTGWAAFDHARTAGLK